MAISKSCRNCESRKWLFEDEEMCMFSGYTCDSTRRSAELCGPNYEGWQLRNGGILTKTVRAIKNIFIVPEDEK